MKATIILFLLFLSAQSFAQIRFEKGYIIWNSGNKTNCYIKNKDWRDNPTSFTYKNTEVSNPQKANLSDVKAFGIGLKVEFIRAKVEIDQSSIDVSNLSRTRAPQFKTDTVLLKVLVAGKASLYSYENNSMVRYFYNVAGNSIEQLVYKEYTNEYGKIFRNRDFTIQLWNNVRCPTTSINSIKTIQYEKKDLVEYFRTYNKCVNKAFTDYTQSEKKKMFILTIDPGVELTSLSLDNRLTNSTDVNFGTIATFRFGTELGFILPFNNGKWHIFLEPTYQYFFSNKIIGSGFLSRKVTVDYKSLELPLGIKYYFFLNNKLHLFISGALVADFPYNSTITYTNPNKIFNVASENSLAFGTGLDFKRFNMEFRYYSNRKILANAAYWDSTYKKLVFTMGYRIL